ncbi:MAG: RHS repeat-associated core domain-containing protein [Pyrinomonadaceae bacterium]
MLLKSSISSYSRRYSTNRSYSNESSGQAPTPAVTYTYDNLPNAVGKLTKVENSVSKTEYTEFDILGRVTKSRQTTEGTSYGDTEYKYNLSGALSETKYPSGRVVRNVLDNTGRLSIVQSKKDANHGFRDYAKGFQYTATGAVSDMQLGNGKWESTTFNSRLQPTKIALGTVQGGDDKLNLAYEYNTSGVADNNGNVLKQTITVNSTPGQNNGFTAVQSYAYDELNRLKSATETIGGTQSWKEAYTFDRYGHKNYDESQTTTLTRNCGTAPNLTICQQDREMENPEIDSATNRIKELQPDGDSVKDYEYDPAGNTTKDPDGRTFQYDGENKQIKVSNTAGTIGEYSFDGDGKRVKKRVPATGETTHFIHDAGGKLIAEYSTIVEPTSTAKANYLTNDTLGSPRILTDRDGNVGSRRDFLPYGAEITNTVNTNRTSTNGYAGDQVKQKFTGYSRNEETELDFTQARMFSYHLGRFTTVDEVTKDSDLNDPQSWDKYLYVRNNPLNLTDPTGEKAEFDVQVDRKTKVVTVTVTASVGLWSKPGKTFKPNLSKVRKNVEAQLKKWGGTMKIAGGYTLNVKANVTVKTFDSARSTDDVLKADSSVMNVIQLVDRPAGKECGNGANSCIGGGDAATINNPDGTLPDIGTWRYTTARDKNEPAHEFFHILGKSHNAQEKYGNGWTGGPFAEQGTTNTSGATFYDYTRAFGDDVTKAIEEAKKEDNKSRWLPKRDVIVRPTRIVRCCSP